VNWGYLVSGDLAGSSAKDQVVLAEWLNAGGRGLIVEQGGEVSGTEGMAAVPRWFGLGTLGYEDARRYQAPASWEGNVAEILPRFTSEAAAKFGLGRRGVITQGAIADLVLWSAPADVSSPNLRDCKPRFVMIDGHLIDLSQPERAKHGRFLGK
jgi:hypothetical protein